MKFAERKKFNLEKCLLNENVFLSTVPFVHRVKWSLFCFYVCVGWKVHEYGCNNGSLVVCLEVAKRITKNEKHFVSPDRIVSALKWNSVKFVYLKIDDADIYFFACRKSYNFPTQQENNVCMLISLFFCKTWK